ncbi:NAD(P)/FAD-dependent oxidoreductase [Tumebacillus lipolyticus]|uniref:NAD(P)/FAD-dependent oxidoreductase n=1 Tax=Tumebacillus lipolyticus TaxID=1280370 RepID=A0ABW4ZZG1_9BACL
MKHRADVAILGGGTAGCTAAYLLARAGFSALIIERGRASGWMIGEGLPPSSTALLHQLGLYERFLQDGHLPSFGNRSAWGSTSCAEHNFLFEANGHGWHIDRAKFDAMLAEFAIQQGALLLDRTELKELRQTDVGWRLHLTQGIEVEADFLIDATGRNCHLARRLNMQRIAFDRLACITGWFAADSADQDSQTVLEAVEDGWWYSSLLPEGQRVVSFLSDADLPQTRSARLPHLWKRQLDRTSHISSLVRKDAGALISPPRIVNANSSCLPTPIGAGWLAIGDAACAYDPLSSQGMLMALGTAIEATEALQSVWRGDVTALDEYQSFIRQMYGAYLNSRDAYYAMERRFPHSLFWQRRHRAKRDQTPLSRNIGTVEKWE